MSYFFFLLENVTVAFLYHPREFCLGAGLIHSKPADVTTPESEQFLVKLRSGLQMAHSLVLNNVLEPGSPDKHLRVLSHSLAHALSLLCLFLSHTNSSAPTSPQQKSLHRGHCSPAEKSPRDGWSARRLLSLLLGRPFGGKALLS